MRDIYVDESCPNGHAHMLFGAFVAPTDRVAALEAELESIAAANGLTKAAEWKWTKVSRAKLAAYQLIVDRAFEHMND